MADEVTEAEAEMTLKHIGNTPQTVTNVDWTTKGVDVSGNQGKLVRGGGWDSIAAAGYDFAVIKAVQGDTDDDDFNDYVYKHLAAWCKAAVEAGIPDVGVYAFAWPDKSGRSLIEDARGEAEVFLRACAKHKVDRYTTLRPTLDYETSNGLNASEHTAWILEWCEVVEDELDTPPILYTYDAFATHRLAGGKHLRHLTLWLASYPSDLDVTEHAFEPHRAPVVTRVGVEDWDPDVWQWTGHGRVVGVHPDLDLNRVRTPEAMEWLRA